MKLKIQITEAYLQLKLIDLQLIFLMIMVNSGSRGSMLKKRMPSVTLMLEKLKRLDRQELRTNARQQKLREDLMLRDRKQRNAKKLMPLENRLISGLISVRKIFGLK